MELSKVDFPAFGAPMMATAIPSLDTVAPLNESDDRLMNIKYTTNQKLNDFYLQTQHLLSEKIKLKFNQCSKIYQFLPEFLDVMRQMSFFDVVLC